MAFELNVDNTLSLAWRSQCPRSSSKISNLDSFGLRTLSKVWKQLVSSCSLLELLCRWLCICQNSHIYLLPPGFIRLFDPLELPCSHHLQSSSRSFSVHLRIFSWFFIWPDWAIGSLDHACLPACISLQKTIILFWPTIQALSRFLCFRETFQNIFSLPTVVS